MGNAKARGDYSARKAVAVSRGGKVERHLSAPLPEPHIMGGVEWIPKNVKGKATFIQRRQKKGTQVSADGRREYQWDGVSVRRTS